MVTCLHCTVMLTISDASQKYCYAKSTELVTWRGNDQVSFVLRPYTIYLQVDINENEAGGNSVDRGCVTFGLYQGEYSVERQFGSTSDKFDLGMYAAHK